LTLLIGALTIGFILSLLAMGVLISFRIFSFPDITAEGSITLGAAVAATLLVNGYNPLFATVAAVISGMLAGSLTGVLHTRFKINGLLSGILVMTALYSINLHIMGRSNVPLLSAKTLLTWAERAGAALLHGAADVNVAGWEVNARDISVLGLSAVAAIVAGWILFIFFKTDIGTAMRATGDNSQMIRAMGVNDGNMIVLGLALSNGLVALAGALLAQYQGFSDVQMGIGMLVWGLASVIIGEALVGLKQIHLLITGSIMGSVLFRLLVAIALRWGLDPNDLKLITAAFVFLALILPGLLAKANVKRAGVPNA
jgi:putative tryptophan/tyrosine transport system permease protein